MIRESNLLNFTVPNSLIKIIKMNAETTKEQMGLIERFKKYMSNKPSSVETPATDNISVSDLNDGLKDDPNFFAKMSGSYPPTSNFSPTSSGALIHRRLAIQGTIGSINTYPNNPYESLPPLPKKDIVTELLDCLFSEEEKVQYLKSQGMDVIPTGILRTVYKYHGPESGDRDFQKNPKLFLCLGDLSHVFSGMMKDKLKHLLTSKGSLKLKLTA